MAQHQELIVTKTGEVRAIYSPLTTKIADALGTSEIARASHVEPTGELREVAKAYLLETGHDLTALKNAWWADMLVTQQPQVLGPFVTRDEALAAEVLWLQTNNLPERRQLPPTPVA